MPPENPLPDFCRLIWTGARARAVWEPRIAAIGEHFAAAERESVETGIRSAALQSLPPEQFLDLASRATKKGLVATPVGTQGHAHGYAASAIQETPTGPWDYRVALTTLTSAARFAEAWASGDDETAGRLLGYPECCRRFFIETWAAGSVDPTWEMADHGAGPVEANILLRWLGVRYVPHLPCGFRCEGTIELGRKLRALIRKRERDWMDELLSMPMLWSSLHGIGEVVTPVVTLNFRTEVSHESQEIQREGEGTYPEQGATGLRFPYRRFVPAAAEPRADAEYIDNGFSSREAMDASHEMILSALKGLGNGGAVVDLGAGNGELLRKLGRGVGVESDAGRVDRRVWPSVRLGYIQDSEEVLHAQKFEIAIISVRRFGEFTEEQLIRLRAWLECWVDRVLIYQYEEPQFARVVAPRDVPMLEAAKG